MERGERREERGEFFYILFDFMGLMFCGGAHFPGRGGLRHYIMCVPVNFYFRRIVFDEKRRF